MIAADLDGLAPRLLDDAVRLRRVLERSFAGRGLVWSAYEFWPRGVSVTGMSRRARVVVHTWPESSRATLDVWAADADANALVQRAVDELENESTAPERPKPSTNAANDAAE